MRGRDPPRTPEIDALIKDEQWRYPILQRDSAQLGMVAQRFLSAPLAWTVPRAPSTSVNPTRSRRQKVFGASRALPNARHETLTGLFDDILSGPAA